MHQTSHTPRYFEGRRILMAGLVVNICLTLVKLGAGVVGRSHALIADGIHSLSDLATDLVAFVGWRYSSKPRDSDHPYGHGKIETLAATFVGILLFGTGVAIVVEGFEAMFEQQPVLPGWIALVAAIFSIVLKEALYRYTLAYANRLGSSVLVANAWHHRSDALSSIATLVGVAGARLGFPVLDPVAAVLVAALIMKVGVDVVVRGSRELVEESLQEEETARLIAAATGVDGVRGVSEMQSRRVGPAAVIDVSITVDGDLTVTQGHTIAHEVEEALCAAMPVVEIVTVHVEPHSEVPGPQLRSPPRAQSGQAL